MGGSVAEIGIRVFLDDLAGQGLGAINQNLARMAGLAVLASGGFRNMAAQIMALGVIAGFAASFMLFAGAINFSVKAAADLQTAMFGVAVATHVPMDVAMQYAPVLMNLAATSTYSTAEIANGIMILGRSGFSLKDIMGQMAQAGIALGIATRTDAVSAFNLLAQVMTAYQLKADQAMHTADLLQFAFEHQTGSVSQLQSALAQVTPIAFQLGVPLDQLLVALDTLGPAMGSTNKAGTALRYMLSGVIQPTNQAIDALASLGIITVSSTTPAMQKFAAQLISSGAASADFVAKNDNSVAGLKLLFAAAKAAGLVPLDAKFNEWAAASGLMQSDFFTASGKAKDLTGIIQTLSEHMKGMNDAAKLAYLKDIFSIRGGQGALELLQLFGKYKVLLDQLVQSHDNAGGAMKRWEQVMQTFGGAMAGLKSSITDLGAVIGLAIIPALTNGANALNRFISVIRTAAAGNAQGAASFLGIGLAASAVGMILAVIITGVGAGLLAFVGIILGVVAGVALLAAGIMAVAHWFQGLYNSSSIIRNAVHQLIDLFTTLGHDIAQAVGVAVSTASGLFKTLGINMGDVRVTGLLLAAIIGTVLAVALGLLVGVIRGVITGLAMFVAGLALVIGGIMAVVHGIISIFEGLFMIIVGLVTQNGTMVQNGFAHIGNGILGILRGAVTAIIGVFVAVFGAIGGLVVGFVMGVINWFIHLANAIIGHSIIPDMLNAIKSAFSSAFSFLIGLIGSWVSGMIARIVQFATSVVQWITNAWNVARAVMGAALSLLTALLISFVVNAIVHIIQFGTQLMTNIQNAWNNARNATTSGISNIVSIVAGLPGRIGSIISGLASSMFQWGANVMSQFAAGLGSMLGAVVNQVANAAGQVANFLAHHSPAKMGPLSNDDTWMPNMMKMFASGIESHIPLLTNASNRAAGGIAGAPSMSRMGTPTGSYGGGITGGGTTTVQLVADGRVLSELVMDRWTGQMQMNGMGRNFR